VPETASTEYELIKKNYKCKSPHRLKVIKKKVPTVEGCYKSCLAQKGCKAFSVDVGKKPWCVLCDSSEGSAHQSHRPGSYKYTINAYKMLAGGGVPETTGAPDTTAAPVTTSAPDTTAPPVTTSAPDTTAAPVTTAEPSAADDDGKVDPAAAGWQLVFRQTAGKTGFFGWKGFSLNPTKPSSPNFAILDQLEKFRGADKKFLFKLKWTGAENIWKQTSNPTKMKDKVEGYEDVELVSGAVGAKCKSPKWFGLARSSSKHALIDGSKGKWWWFAVASKRGFGKAKLIPAGCRKSTKVMELYVCPRGCQ
jgi:hypothetical protein